MRLNYRSRKRLIGILALCCGTAVVLLLVLITKQHMIKEDPSEEICSYPTVTMATLSGSAIAEEFTEPTFEAVDTQVVAAVNESPFAGKFVANITDSLNVRAEAGEEAEIVGKMYPGCVGDVVAVVGDWTQITSGNVSGYVKSEFILTGADAEAKAQESVKKIGTVHADTLRIREDSNTESSAIGLLADGDQVTVVEVLDGWYRVQTVSEMEGYVSAEFMTVEDTFDTAMTMEEIQAKIAAEEEQKRLEAEAAQQAAAEEAAEEAASASTTVAVTQNAAMAASYDDAYLLACLVSMEAGYEPYEGQLAVANVVLNRLRSGAYGSTMSDVIYARGQFPCATGSVMQGYLANGPLPQAQQAANEALAGVNNIGGYSCFINVRYAHFDSYSSYTIIGNHCFH